MAYGGRGDLDSQVSGCKGAGGCSKTKDTETGTGDSGAKARPAERQQDRELKGGMMNISNKTMLLEAVPPEQGMRQGPMEKTVGYCNVLSVLICHSLIQKGHSDK